MITAIKCPHCSDTYDKSKAVGLNENSTRCLNCGMPYVPYENEITMPEFVFKILKGGR